MHRKLTVKEVLLFQGRLRLPSSTSSEFIRDRVSQASIILQHSVHVISHNRMV